LRSGKNLTGIFLRDGIISQDEVEIVGYGLENLGSSLLGMSVTLMLGCCFDFLLGSFMLWLLVFPLRKNAGGYHAETKTRCLLFSSSMLLLSIICFQQVKWSETVYIGVAVVAFLVFFIVGASLVVGRIKLQRHKPVVSGTGNMAE
jgi:accessory gene regulator B